MKKFIISQSVYLRKVHCPISITLRSFVIMLTWKIFAIIISATSLTLVDVYFSSASSSVGEPRLNRKRSINEDSLDSTISLGRSTKQFTFFNPDTDRLYDIDYNPYNPFFRENKIAFECYQNIRLFCDTEINIIKSQNCLRKAIYYYKRNVIGYLDGAFQSFADVHNFYENFPIIAGSISLPSEYCKKEEITDPKCMDDLKLYQELVKKPQIVIPKVSGADFNQELENAIRDANEKAKIESRHEIAMFALLNRSILGLDADSFEKHYLGHISNRVVAANEDHEPYTYCKSLQDLDNSLTALRLG